MPSSGRRLRTEMSSEYDLATLNRMFGMSSTTSLSIMGRIDLATTSRLTTGARV